MNASSDMRGPVDVRTERGSDDYRDADDDGNELAVAVSPDDHRDLVPSEDDPDDPGRE